MKECYSSKAIQDMYNYAQLHMLIEFALLMFGFVVFIYVFDRLRKKI
jgi:hypothetical protein